MAKTPFSTSPSLCVPPRGFGPLFVSRGSKKNLGDTSSKETLGMETRDRSPDVFVPEREAPASAARDGCDCPPGYVIRCAHLGDLRVTLVDTASPTQCFCCPISSQPYAVHLIKGSPHACIYKCGDHPWWLRQRIKSSEHPDLAAAHVAFDAAECELLAGAL